MNHNGDSWKDVRCFSFGNVRNQGTFRSSDFSCCDHVWMEKRNFPGNMDGFGNVPFTTYAVTVLPTHLPYLIILLLLISELTLISDYLNR